MSVPNPDKNFLKHRKIPNSLMTQNNLINSLTSHISLYHSQSIPPSSSNPNPRSSILKWFKSLSVHQRQSHLTTVDFKFTQILIQMLAKLHSHGHCRFIILPDLLSRDLPSLCLRNHSERLIFESTWLFSSREGEKVDDCRGGVEGLDSVTVSEDLIENVEKFVELMDDISNGGFLRGEESELGTDWVELEWLKARGYYCIEAFLANKLEVALRLAWVKLKEKLSAAGVAANVFWRKKGCVDWWRNLDAEVRRKVLNIALGKTAKSLTREILKDAGGVSGDELSLFRAGVQQPWRDLHAESRRRIFPKLPADAEFGLAPKPSFSGKDSSFANIFNSLFVLQDIVSLVLPDQGSEYDTSHIFFSMLGSLGTLSDCILRKVRGLVMVISLDCTRLELLGEGTSNSSAIKPSEKLGAGKFMESNEKPGIPHENENHRDISSSTVEMEHTQGLVLERKKTAGRKNRKGRNKKKKSSFSNPVEVRKSEIAVSEAPSFSVYSSDEAAKLCGLSDNVTTQKATNDSLVDHSINEPTREEIDALNIPEDRAVCCTEGISDAGQEHYRSSNGFVDNKSMPSRRETCCGVGQNIVYQVATKELITVSSNEGTSFLNKKNEVKLDVGNKLVRSLDVKEVPALTRGEESVNLHESGSKGFSDGLSYEWPSLGPVYFPSINSHLPPATDRLHLDVGHNWHNHIHQPFLPTVHQARKSPVEGGSNRMLSRPLPMSLDWPPMVRSNCGLAPTMTCNYDPGFFSRRQSAFQKSYTAKNMQYISKTFDDERRCSGDAIDLTEATSSQEIMDEYENHWISEEEYEVHAVSGIDYNQHFGGGVMYWDPSDTGFSRPPSLSSDDSGWPWHEAELNRAVDDMVAFSSSYSTTGLTSPTAASFCSAFDPLVPGHQALGYVMSGNEVPGKAMLSSTVTDAAAEEDVPGSLASLSSDVEGKTGDSLPYPILRPIIIPNMSRERSRSDFKRSLDHKSPCVPPTRREHPRIKRPPSPIVLCVPRAPCPPPPSPVSNSRKHRGFPTVRSGSSSPRHWGVRGWYHDGTNLEEACVRMDGAEVVWPSWRNKKLSTYPMVQPLPGALLQDRLIAMSHLARDQDHPDVLFPIQQAEIQNCPARKASLCLVQSLLHDEIDSFCKQVAAANMARKPFINWAIKRVTRSLQVLWPRSRTNIFGSSATGLSLPTSDVDLVVSLPPVRNLEPIKEAGILEGRNGIKETVFRYHAARYLANQEWVKNDSLKTVENTAIPVIMLVVEVPTDLITAAASNVQSPKEEPIHLTGEHDSQVHSNMVVLEDSISPNCAQLNRDSKRDVKSIRLDISFKSPSHTGLQTTQLVKDLTEQFPAATPLALVLKQFLADRSLDQSYSGGLSSYCLVLLIIRFLQHEHHLGRPINQNVGSLLMDLLYFFGNVFDPRQMRISVQGSGVYINRERGYSIDPIHIDDPLFPSNNVGRNCFRIHQCIKAFSEAYSVLEKELACLPDEGDACSRPAHRILPKIIPSIDITGSLII
ncbi:NTP transf domain-containing protein/PAP assoc domain-containing [Salix suchowensis]|nr:NTP transf domain-containing protein/PAP assoc domain-containing [Salix suchowensis]